MTDQNNFKAGLEQITTRYSVMQPVIRACSGLKAPETYFINFSKFDNYRAHIRDALNLLNTYQGQINEMNASQRQIVVVVNAGSTLEAELKELSLEKNQPTAKTLGDVDTDLSETPSTSVESSSLERACSNTLNKIEMPNHKFTIYPATNARIKPIEGRLYYISIRNDNARKGFPQKQSEDLVQFFAENYEGQYSQIKMAKAHNETSYIVVKEGTQLLSDLNDYNLAAKSK